MLPGYSRGWSDYTRLNKRQMVRIRKTKSTKKMTFATSVEINASSINFGCARSTWGKPSSRMLMRNIHVTASSNHCRPPRGNRRSRRSSKGRSDRSPKECQRALPSRKTWPSTLIAGNSPLARRWKVCTVIHASMVDAHHCIKMSWLSLLKSCKRGRIQQPICSKSSTTSKIC